MEAMRPRPSVYIPEFIAANQSARADNVIPAYSCCLVTKSYLTLCNPMDYSLPGSPVHGIFQAIYWSGLLKAEVTTRYSIPSARL